MRIDGGNSLPPLIYLPGIHGDWTLLAGFRELAKEKFRLVQFTYPRTQSWSLEDYARAVDEEIRALGVTQAWVLAESFSSQVAWAWLKLAQEEATDFKFKGIILAGGFVRYPIQFNLAAARLFFALAPWRFWKLLFSIYLGYSGFRHRNAGHAGNCAREFIDRRTPPDIAAMRARLKLIRDGDYRTTAANANCPAYQLAGAIDPVVPALPVRRWLRRNCAKFNGYRSIWPADHNVLGTEPAKALAQIEEWIARGW
jgi:pimeloyl-ACP methyl ester carboxylesterase